MASSFSIFLSRIESWHGLAQFGTLLLCYHYNIVMKYHNLYVTKISVENIIKQARTQVAVISDKKEFDRIKTRIEEIGYHRCQKEKAKEMADSLKHKYFKTQISIFLSMISLRKKQLIYNL